MVIMVGITEYVDDHIRARFPFSLISFIFPAITTMAMSVFYIFFFGMHDICAVRLMIYEMM